jgi:phage terminase Nu1 subunit (DNA packaging protein)
MTLVSFTDRYHARHGHPPNAQVTKKQLAHMLGRTTRWVELRVAEGMPAGWDDKGRREFDVDECRRWLRERAA